MASNPLTDREVYDRLQLAHQHLMFAKGETQFCETTLRTAEKAISLLQMSILVHSEGIDLRPDAQDRSSTS